jgi:ornithine cyclodeaminase
MPVTFRLLTEADVRAVLSMDDLIETMASALQRFSSGQVTQPVRTIIPVNDDAFAGFMPALVRSAREPRRGSPTGVAGEGGSLSGERGESLGAKIVTVFGGNHARGLDSHLASIVLLDPETGALQALLDGRYITEARTAAVSAVSSRLLARPNVASLAIIGSGVQARSHLEALSRIHTLRQVTVWSPQKSHRDQFVEWAKSATGSRSDAHRISSGSTSGSHRVSSGSTSGSHRVGSGSTPGSHRVGSGSTSGADRVPIVSATDHAGEAVVGADVIVLVTSSPTPVLEDGWVKPGAHVISVGACRPNQREMDPALVARARLFVDSRAAALVESGDVVLGVHEQRFGPDHIVAELGELVGSAPGRRTETEVTIFKSLGLAVEDVMAADLAYRRAKERGVGAMLTF